MASTDNFVGKVVGLVIAVVVICAVAIPVLTGMVGENTADKTYPINTADPNMAMVGTIMQILPVFLVLAILIMIVKMFLDNKDF